MQIGERVQRFEVIAHLGTGGMGTVFRARDPQLERDVAIKLMAQPTGMPALLSENQTVDLRTDAPASADDLLREARMMARLSHPNVLPVYEVGLVAGSVFVVMEHIAGCDLRDWLGTPRSTAEVIDVFAQAARGLAAAHECGIVHRDFKPENVLVGGDGRVRVADFGLSRLAVRPHHAMRRLDDDKQGTPRYMAPELWRGDPATPQSDVYAFSVALAEAFGAERDARLYETLRVKEVPAALRDLIVAGTDDNPTVRPALATLVAALSGKPRIATGWLIAGSLGVLAAAGAIAFALTSDPEPTCAVAPATSWDAPHRALLTGLVTASNATVTDKVLSALDETQRAIDAGWRATCTSLATHSLTGSQVRARQSCLERRQFELDARIERFMRSSVTSSSRLLDRARVAHVADCDSIVAPAMHTDRDKVLALYHRLVRGAEPPLASADELLAIAKEAAALGERELEARAIFAAGERIADADRVSEGDQLMQKGYSIALELRAIDMQARMLSKRSRNLMRIGDARGANSVAKLALDLIENKQTSPFTRAHVYATQSYSAFERGNYQDTLAKAAKGLVAVEKDGHRMPEVELSFRLHQVNALRALEGRRAEALNVARSNVEWARKNLGERTEGYAITLNLMSAILLDEGDKAEGLALISEALAVVEQALPPGSAIINAQRLDYATALHANGKIDDAYRAIKQVHTALAHNEATKNQLPLATFTLGRILCSLDRCSEGLAHLERSVELGTSQYGAEHQYTQAYRHELLDLQLELDRLDDAERTYAALERNYEARPDDKRKFAQARGELGVRLLLQQGKSRKAEERAREALATWQDLGGEPAVRATLLGSLAEVLLAQRRTADARSVLEQAGTLAAGDKAVSELTRAELDTLLARADLALGHRQAAVEHAKRAKLVLERYPMARHARARLEEVLR